MVFGVSGALSRGASINFLGVLCTNFMQGRDAVFSAADDDLYLGTDHHAVVTLWFVTAAEPAKVIASSPKADRGFGRKYLAQLNPSWPITPIGQFALNRSAQASKGEFYIAGLPGVAIVQTVIEDATLLSEIDPKLRNSFPAADVYAFAVNDKTGVGGFAHWSGGNLRRCFSARRARVYEDHGLPEPFEAPYWAGEKAEPQGGIALPFFPIDLVAEAQRAWLGFDPETSPDVNVVAYAIDGRPEPKITPRSKSTASIDEVTAVSTTKLGIGSKHDYDDYEDYDAEGPDGDELVRFVDSASVKARRIARILGTAVARGASILGDKIRHSDRPSKPRNGLDDNVLED